MMPESTVYAEFAVSDSWCFPESFKASDHPGLLACQLQSRKSGTATEHVVASYWKSEIELKTGAHLFRTRLGIGELRSGAGISTVHQPSPSKPWLRWLASVQTLAVVITLAAIMKALFEIVTLVSSLFAVAEVRMTWPASALDLSIAEETSLKLAVTNVDRLLDARIRFDDLILNNKSRTSNLPVEGSAQVSPAFLVKVTPLAESHVMVTLPPLERGEYTVQPKARSVFLWNNKKEKEIKDLPVLSIRVHPNGPSLLQDTLRIDTDAKKLLVRFDSGAPKGKIPTPIGVTVTHSKDIKIEDATAQLILPGHPSSDVYDQTMPLTPDPGEKMTKFRVIPVPRYSAIEITVQFESVNELNSQQWGDCLKAVQLKFHHEDN